VKRIFLTGATGQIGWELARTLMAMGQVSQDHSHFDRRVSLCGRSTRQFAACGRQARGALRARNARMGTLHALLHGGAFSMTAVSEQLAVGSWQC